MSDRETDEVTEEQVAAPRPTITATPAGLGELVEVIIRALKKREKGETEEKEPAEPPPWVLDGAPSEVISATLTGLATFVGERVRGRWGIAVPRCWFWHQPMTLSLLAIRQRYEDELVEMAASAVIQFFGYELFAYLDNTLIENEGKCPPVGHALHKRLTLEEFIDSPYFDYVWLGKALPAPEALASVELDGGADADE